MKINFKDDGSQTILSLDILGKEVDSEGWLQTIVTFNAKGISAKFQISLMLNDLYTFYDQLVFFTKNLKGQAIFSTIEDNVNLIFSTDGLGHIKIDGTLRQTYDHDLEIRFVIHTDQTFLSPLLTECNEILKHYQPQ